ncbi:hypothetical protein [Candidatus Cyanaurora vandensis]|uniref:hypothetical protein n=1 Tax=Candidatus Cyanaurora vandensis TaxID=2714958 RepID=UPI002580D9B5|nr:hypothetical protein [Candidatus Cyanaurora vandensis]
MPPPEDLQQLLYEREQLIQELAQELIQVNQHNRVLQQAADPATSPAQPNERVAWLERQLTKAREDLAAKERENYVLLERVQQGQQENQKLQQYLRELPDLYRRKFTERMGPFKERMNQVERENHRLQQCLQTLGQLPDGAQPLLPESTTEL